MTHSDFITLLFDLKASELEFLQEDFLTLGYSICTGLHHAQIFHANYCPLKNVCTAKMK